MSLLRRTKLRAKKPIRKISERRIKQLNAEVAVRIALAERCDGRPIAHSYTIKQDGTVYELLRVTCLGGTCEICGKPAGGELLEPHEKVYRSHGGQVSLDNSLMCQRRCHLAQHGIKVVDTHPQWGAQR